MKKLEVFLDSVTVARNGHRRSETGKLEDLVIAFEWDDANFHTDLLQAAFSLEDVKDGEPKYIKADADGDPLKDLNRRLFKTDVDGLSVLRVTLLKREKLSGFGKLFSKLLGAVFGIITGGIGGIGGTLTQTVVGHLFNLKDEWEDPIGVATVIMDDSNLNDGSLEVPLEINEEVRKALMKLYTRRTYDNITRRWYEVAPSDEVMALLNADTPTNGRLILGLKVSQ